MLNDTQNIVYVSEEPLSPLRTKRSIASIPRFDLLLLAYAESNDQVSLQGLPFSGYLLPHNH